MRAEVIAAFVLVCAACDDGDGVPPPPEPVKSTITLEKRGDGASNVSTTPAGLVCDVLCAGGEEEFVDVDSVTVVVEPSRTSQFIRAFCTADGQETVTGALDGAAARITVPTIVDGVGVDWRCVAELRLVHTLQVIVATGTGTGRVRGALPATLDEGSPPRLDCPGDCVGGYFVGEVETLTATADAGSRFVRWNFCSDATDTVIDVVMDENQNCEAIFDVVP